MDARIFAENILNSKDAETLVAKLPLGKKTDGETYFSHRVQKAERYHHTCVTGKERTCFIEGLICALSTIYAGRGAAFVVLSPNPVYTRLLRLKNADVTVPYIRSEKDLSSVLSAVFPLIERARKKATPKLFLVLDGLEELGSKELSRTLKAYLPFFEKTVLAPVEIITGVNMENSIFSGDPSVFVGAGNTLVSVDELTYADATYIDETGNTCLPERIDYPLVTEKGKRC